MTETPFLPDDQVEAMLKEMGYQGEDEKPSNAGDLSQEGDPKEEEEEGPKEEEGQGGEDPLKDIEGPESPEELEGNSSEEDFDPFEGGVEDFNDEEEEQGFIASSPNRKKYPSSMYQPPKSLSDFFCRAERRIRCIASKFGVPPSEQDDFWGEVCLKFVKEGTLEKYNPCKASWSTFLYRVVGNFAMQYMKALQKDKAHTSYSLIEGCETYEEGTVPVGGALMDQVSFKVDGKDPVKEIVVSKVAHEQTCEYVKNGLPWARGCYSIADWVNDILDSCGDVHNPHHSAEQASLLLDRFAEHLDCVEQKRFSVPSKLRIKQHLGKVLRSLRGGRLHSEVSAELGISTGSLSNYKKRLQECAQEFCREDIC